MKIVFLDFDGVLNTFGEFLGAPPSRRFDPAAIERLNAIVVRTGARVVVSSAWRIHHDLDSLRALLASAGFTGEVIDCTPPPALGSIRFAHPGFVRCQEIQAWLDARAEPPDSFVILDDMELELLAAYHVRTDPETGLCDEHVDMAIAVLGAD